MEHPFLMFLDHTLAIHGPMNVKIQHTNLVFSTVFGNLAVD